MADKELISPPPNAASPEATCPKLEQMVSNMISQDFKKDYVVSVLGTAVFERLGLGEDWSIFESEMRFDDSQYVSVLSILNEALDALSLQRLDEEFGNFYTVFMRVVLSIDMIHDKRLQVVITNYFSSRFPGSNIEFIQKGSGRQFGCTAHIAFEGGPERARKYYVKTHSAGRFLSCISAPKAVDVKELMVYKILEKLGVGCESHFFHRSPQDVYIATLDASHGGSFKEFIAAAGDLYNRGDEEYGRTLWGGLNVISGDRRRHNREQIEECIREDSIANNFVTQIVILDMLSHILRLTDLLNNTGNFGFVFESETSLPKLKVIDFLIGDDNRFVNPSYFLTFVERNGFYRYWYLDRVLRYVLLDRAVNERVQSAIQVLTVGPLCGLLDCIDSALTDVEAYVKTTELFVDKDSLCRSLKEYHEAIRQNYAYFVDSLTAWMPVNSKK